MYSRDQINRVREALDIVEMIREYVPTLSGSGRSIKGLCPFHNEKTPSFHVQPEKGFFKCFGCGESGDIISFFSKLEQLSFSEALERLAGRAGITLKRDDRVAQAPQEAHKEKISRALEIARGFYFDHLWNQPEGEAAREYLTKRSIRRETADQFQLGYAPTRGTSIIEVLVKKGIPVEVAQEAGLAARSQQGRFYDPLFGRLVFPIYDGFGHVVGFGGRLIPKVKTGIPFLSPETNDTEGPKYLNSPETPVFSKGKLLYGLVQAKNEILKTRRAIVVEGYMDVIAIHQEGVLNAVAPLGTALTRDHAKLLKRYADEVLAYFDPDEAGQRAVWRSLEPLLLESLFVRVVNNNEAADPDEILQRGDIDLFHHMVDSAPDAIEYLLLKSGVDGKADLQQKIDLVARLSPILRWVTNGILQDEWVGKIATHLQINPDTLQREIQKGSKNKNSPGGSEGRVSTLPLKSKSSLPSLEEEYLWLMIKTPELCLAGDVQPDDFENARLKQIFLIFQNQIKESGQVNLTDAVDQLNEVDKQWFRNFFFENREYHDPQERHEQLIKDFQYKRDRKQLTALREKMTSGPVDSEILGQYKELLRRVKGSQRDFASTPNAQ